MICTKRLVGIGVRSRDSAVEEPTMEAIVAERLVAEET